MIWDCGLIRRDHKVLEAIQRYEWRHLPEDVQFELAVWLAMPGFSDRYHAHTLGRDRRWVAHHRTNYAEYRTEVASNWLSASRPDCIELCWMRPPKGDIPWLCRVQMRRDFKQGMRQSRIAHEYGVSAYAVNQLTFSLGEWVMELPEDIAQILKEDDEVTQLGGPRRNEGPRRLPRSMTG